MIMAHYENILQNFQSPKSLDVDGNMSSPRMQTFFSLPYDLKQLKMANI